MRSLNQFRIALFLFTLAFFPVTFLQAETIDHSAWNSLLKQYVREGLVDYQGLLSRQDQLNQYLDQLSQVSPDELGTMNREDRIAYWVNLYNASLVRMILEAYPIERVDQIPAAFEIKTIKVLGDYFSLAELRDEILRKGFRDERLLIALVSGRMDSAFLSNQAYEGNQLESQLNEISHQFVENDTKNLIAPGSKKIFLSPLFQNFADDFILNFSREGAAPNFSEKESAVISFFLHHLNDPEKRLFLDSGRYKIKYLPEDMRLNDVKNIQR